MKAQANPSPDRAVVLTKATLSAAEQLGLNNADLAAVIGVSEPTISRIKGSHGRTIDPQSKEGELALMLIRVFRSLDPLIGGDEGKRKAWMSSSELHLQDKKSPPMVGWEVESSGLTERDH